MQSLGNVLWADDEIDFLKPQVKFLQEKGYIITTVTNGQDAIEKARENQFDLVFLDEQMPGLSGIETLIQIKSTHKHLPVVMVTKSEEESIMEEAIGAQISDYLIKPVKPQQLLLMLKKHLESKQLVSDKTAGQFRMDFQNIMTDINNCVDMRDWMDVYRRLVFWELELDQSAESGMHDVFVMQKDEANNEFAKFVMKNYQGWMSKPNAATPTMSHTLMPDRILPALKADTCTFVVLIDNLRYDQWKTLQPMMNQYFRTVKEDMFCSILPTVTQYSRNAIFAGLTPLEINKRYPNQWFFDEDEEGKNNFEESFLRENLVRHKMDMKFSYTKVKNHREADALADKIPAMLNNSLNVIVYNFIDMLSHARTEMEVLKELAGDERGLRSVTRSWFENSPLLDALRRLQGKNVQLIITTDHGSIRVKTPAKVVGDRETTTNLRYKHGKHLTFNPKEVFEMKNPEDFKLPKPHVTSSYIIAKNDIYLCYPNNYGHYVNYYKNTFQHGGLSMEEMLIPLIFLESK
jgi:CheY-like chemotaxis protein